VQDFRLRQVLVDQLLEALPRPTVALAASPQVTRYRVVVEISSHHLFRQSPVCSIRSCLHLRSLAAMSCNFAVIRLPTVFRFTVNLPLFQIVPQICLNPGKLNVSGFPTPLPFCFGEPPELNQADDHDIAFGLDFAPLDHPLVEHVVQ
jgi:hypothetical protein